MAEGKGSMRPRAERDRLPAISGDHGHFSQDNRGLAIELILDFRALDVGRLHAEVLFNIRRRAQVSTVDAALLPSMSVRPR